MIANKWKIFAMGQILADWNADTVVVFDAITDSTHDEAITDFEFFEIDPWEVFENWPPVDICKLIWTMANEAQTTENKGE
jgi:hypothetical protein